MEKYSRSNIECLNFEIIPKNFEEKSLLVDIYIKNNNDFDIIDVKIKSNISTYFTYINKTLCIDDIPFYDFGGIETIDIDSLYAGEEIKISYELIKKQDFILDYIDLELMYKDTKCDWFNELKCKKIEQEIFNQVEVVKKRLEIIKTANFNTTIVSEVISYEISIENISEELLKNIEIVDIQKKEIEIVGDYVYLNNKEIEVSSLARGVYLKYLEKNQKAYIRFNAKVLGKGENSEIYNKIRGCYECETNGVSMYYTEEFESEKIRVYDVNLDIKKTTNKAEIVLGEELEFKVDIKNIGEVDCYSISLYEVLSDEIEFIEGSFYKEKENINIGTLENGINIGNLLKGEKLTFFYKVSVKKICSKGYISSEISANFKYKCNFKSPIKSLYMQKKEYRIEAINPGFTEFEIENSVEIEKAIIEIIDINQDIELEEHYIVKTATGKSLEGIIMNSYKLVVVGYLNVYLEYSESAECEEVYIYKDKQKFVEEIVLSEDYKVGTGINIRAQSKNIYLKKINDGKILYKNSNLIEAIVKEI